MEKRKTIYSKYEEAQAQKEVKQLARRHSLKDRHRTWPLSFSSSFFSLVCFDCQAESQRGCAGAEESSWPDTKVKFNRWRAGRLYRAMAVGLTTLSGQGSPQKSPYITEQPLAFRPTSVLCVTVLMNNSQTVLAAKEHVPWTQQR